jgi:hypothetical protein
MNNMAIIVTSCCKLINYNPFSSGNHNVTFAKLKKTRLSQTSAPHLCLKFETFLLPLALPLKFIPEIAHLQKTFGPSPLLGIRSILIFE